MEVDAGYCSDIFEYEVVKTGETCGENGEKEIIECTKFDLWNDDELEDAAKAAGTALLTILLLAILIPVAIFIAIGVCCCACNKTCCFAPKMQPMQPA